MIDQLNYRFVSRKKLLERGSRAIDQRTYPTSEDIRLMNSVTVDRMKSELDLAEHSSIADLRAAVTKLAE